jgi:protochlorophyllide reductase
MKASLHILMTGGTAGIGLVAARMLIGQGAELVIGSREPTAAPEDLRAFATIEALDLADLVSVRDFADRMARQASFDALVLNAGLQTVSGRRSAQGFELTFAANHLAHQLLASRLAPQLAPGGRVVITSSGTHDPDQKTGMPPPRHADARKLAHPQTDPERDSRPGPFGRRAYSTSKLCNVMTARELARRLAVTRPDVSVAAFDPGFTPGTGLARDYPGVGPFIFRRILPLVVRGPRVSTAAISGGHLAALTAEPRFAASRGGYYAVQQGGLFEIAPSSLARDDAACARLWEDSEALLASV